MYTIIFISSQCGFLRKKQLVKFDNFHKKVEMARVIDFVDSKLRICQLFGWCAFSTV
jgi:hypothetical protein